MVWANPRMKRSLSDMRSEWTWLNNNARTAPEEFKAYWRERAEKLAEGILRREAEDALARHKAAWEERLRKIAQRKARQERLEKAFPAIREARLEKRRSRTTGRP